MKGILIVIIGLFISQSAFSQENQNDEIAKISSGKFTVHKVVEKGYKDYKFETASKPWPVDFKMNNGACNEVFIKRAGIIDETYIVDLPKYPAYYSTATTEIVVSVINKKIYYYKWSIKSGSEIVYILSEKSVSSYETEKNDLDDYRRNILSLQSNAREERIEKKNELAEEEEAENTLAGKEIKGIQIKLVNSPKNIGHLTIVAIGIEVTLANGTLLKTKNLGGKTPYSDFEVQVSGGDYAGGDFKVANDASKIKNDQISIVAKSKFANNSISGKFSYPLNYKSDVFYQFQGGSGQFGRANTVGYSKHGGDGRDGKDVNVSAELKTINGESVNEITITNANTGELMSKCKLHVSSKITINVCGGNGGSGASGDYSSDGSGGNGGEGGNAGTVMLSGSGSNSLDITVLSNGGKAGQGGKGKTTYDRNGTNGSSGSNGSLIK
jgi:hypothetical protein